MKRSGYLTPPRTGSRQLQSPKKQTGFSSGLQSQQSFVLSKSMTLAHQFNFKCQIPGHQQNSISHICLEKNCDNNQRVACQKCLIGNHSEHQNSFIKIQDIINTEFLNNATSAISQNINYQIPNYPLDDQGRQIKQFIEIDDQYQHSLFIEIENYFSSLSEKINNSINKIKSNMTQEIKQFYSRGDGVKSVQFLEQMKQMFYNGWNVQDLQITVKELLNKEISLETFKQKFDYQLSSNDSQQKKMKAAQFFVKNFSKSNSKANIDFKQLQELESQLFESLKKFNKPLDTKNYKNKEHIKGIPFSKDKGIYSNNNQNNQTQQWNDLFHDILNYLQEQKNKFQEKDVIQFSREFYADGSKYEGFFVNGYRSILGTRYYSDGNIYCGEWLDGSKNGRGVLYYFKGNIYEGSWLDDKKNGEGKETYPSGAFYFGEWNEDQRNGLGFYLQPDGQKYEGTYNRDKRDGDGLITHKNGIKEKVKFKNGQQI